MRLIYLSVITLMAATAPAVAGTDSGAAPNPFTEPSAGQTTTSGAVNGTDAAGQPPSVPTVSGGDASGQQGSQSSDPSTSSGFYQQQKKDGDSR